MKRYQVESQPANAASSHSPSARARRRRGARAAAPFKRKLLVETIEQRVLMDADPLAVATVAGSIDSVGEVDHYTFHLDSTARVAFDSLLESGNLRWSLRGPSGQLVSQAGFNSLSGTAASYAPRELGPGDYQLDVSGSGDSTGSYALRLLDLERATTISLDTAVSGSFDAAAQTLAFGFDAQAGDQLFLTWQQHPDVYLRIYDPWGQQVNANYGTGQYQDSAVPALAYSGRYTVLLDASAGVPAGTGFGFTLHRTAAPAQDLGAWTGPALALDANLAAAGDRAVFTFTLDSARSVLLDSLTNNDSLRVSITGPDGQVVDSAGQQVRDRGLGNYADHAYYGTDRIDLRAGTYTVVIAGSGTAHGAASLRLLDVAGGTLVARGSAVSAELAPGNAVQVYRFDAAAGDLVDIDVLGVSGGNPSYKLLDPYGRRVTMAWGMYDTNGVQLGVTGRYTLVVSGENARTDATPYSFQLVDRGNTPPAPLPSGTPVALGETAEGSIAANDSAVWNFTVGADTTAYFDPLTQLSSYSGVTWSLRGPRGVEVDGATYGGYQNYSWDDGARLLKLPAGDYALTVRSSVALPSVQFRVLDVAAGAAPALPGSVVAGQLDPGSGMAAYTFDAAAGQRLYFRALPGTDTSYLHYRLLDSSGRDITGGARGWGDWEATLAQGGSYTLLVEGANSHGAGPIDYRFMVALPQDTQAVLDPVAGAGTGVSWTSDGAEPAVRLDGRHEIRIDPNPALNLAHDVSFQVRVRVDSFDQDWQSIVYKGGNVNDASQRTYSLWVNSSGLLHLSTSDNWGEMTVQSAPGSVQAGQWYDVTGVLDRTSGQMLLYVDGVLAGSSALRNYVSDARVQDTPLYLGNAHEGWSNNDTTLHGAIGEFRLWDTALGAAQVAGYVAGAPDAADAHLKAWLKLDEGAGAALADASTGQLAAAIHSRFEGLPGVVAGDITMPGQQALYHLSLAETTSFYIDTLTPYTRSFGGAFNLSIAGPTTSISENLTWFNNRMVTLPAGDYTFTVDGNGAATGGYAFRLIDQASAQPLAFGQDVSGTLRPGDTAQLYRFDASAGDAVFFQRLGASGFNPSWRLVDPFGREVFGRTGMSDRDPATLAVSGAYTLIVDGDYGNYDQASAYSFRLFKVAQAAPQAIDIAAGSDAGVQRTGGQDGGAVQVSDAQYIELANTPATDATGTFTLQASFKIDHWSSGSWIPLLTKTTADPLRQVGVFINNDGRIHVGANPSSGGYNSVESASGAVAAGSWQNLAAVYDRASSQLRVILNGQLVAQGYLDPRDAVDLDAPLRIGYDPEGSAFSGHQVTVDQLAIWNRALSAADAAAAAAAPLAGDEPGLAALYRFDEADGAAVTDAVAGGAGSIVRMADRVNGLVTGRIAQPGQTATYTFTLDQPRQLYLDSLTRRSDLRWSLQGPGVSTGDAFYNADANNGRNLLNLAAGTYSVTVDGDRAATGDFMFRLVDAGQAPTIALDQQVNGRLDPGSVSQVYRFDAAAGQRLFFDVLSYTGQAPAWRLLDPSGAPVFGVNWFGDRDATTLARSGTYTLIVEDYAPSGAADPVRDFSFVLRSVTDRSVGLALGGRTEWGPAWSAGPEAGSSAPQLGNGGQVVVAPDPALELGGSMTIEAMVKLDALGQGWMPLVSRASDFNHQGYGIWIGAQGQIYFDSNAGGQFWNAGTGAGAIAPGAWHRVSVSVNRTGGAVALYVDGQLQGSRTLSAAERAAPASLPDAELRAGGTVLTDGRVPLTGAVADLRLWNVALDGATIAARSSQRLAGDETGLVLNLKLDEGSGSALADSGPLGLAGRLESVNAKLDGTVVEDQIAAPGQRITYDIDPDHDVRLLFDGLTNRDGFNWTLRDESGNAVVDLYGQTLSGRDLRYSDAGNQAYFMLRAGRHYHLEVDAAGDKTGRFAFRLADLADATALAFDTVVNANIDPGNATALYSFDAAAGDQVVLDYLSQSGSYAYWRLFGPNGQQLLYSAFTTDSGTLTLAQSGRYTIAIADPIEATGAAQRQFQVRLAGHVELPAPPAGTALDFVGGVAEVAGTLSEINQDQVFTFTLAEPTRIYVDQLDGYPMYNSTWALSGPEGEVARHWGYDSDGSNRSSFYELPAGEYRFSVSSPYTWALGNFKYRLVDVDAAAQPLEFGSAASGPLAPATSAAFYSFTAAAGERLTFANGASSNMSNSYYRVLDADTLAVVAQNSYGYGLNDVHIARDGRYILAIEGYYGAGGDASYTLTGYRNTDASDALTLGARTAGSIVQPGDTHRYSFTLGQASRLWFDSLAPRGDLTWRVLDRDGIAVAGARSLLEYPWTDDARIDLGAGDYTLVIDGSGAATGDYAFRLLDLAAATPIQPGTAVSGQLAPADASVMYRFDAQAGERYYFDLLSRSSGNTYWRLLDPYGRDVFHGGGLADQGTTAMPYSGTYTVVVEGYPHDTVSGYGNVNFSFNVQPVLEQAPIPLTIGVRAAPNLQVQELAAAGADGSVHSGGTVLVSWFSANSGDRDLSVPIQERVVVRNAAGETLVNQLVSYDPATAGVIAAGSRVARSASVALPAGSRGAGALTISVFTDVGNAVLEQGAQGETDNSAQIAVDSVLVTYPDLTVGNVGFTPGSNLAAGDQVTVSWRVANGGDLATSGGWADRVVVRNLSTGEIVFDGSSRIEGGAAVIAPGASLDRQLVFNWPAGRKGAGQFQVTVTTDADGEVAEYNAADTAESNNSAGTSFTSAPDLAIDGLQVLTATPVSGGEVQLAWNVRNDGNAPTPAGWFDHITAVNLDTGATLLNLDVSYNPASPLAAGASAARAFTLRLPEGAGSVGRIRFTVTADQNAAGAGTLPELNEANNSAATERDAILRLAPNLVVDSFSAPAVQRSGDAGAFSWTVRNAGNAATGATAWNDRIVLSRDAIIGNGDDVTVATIAHSGALGAGESYTVDASALVPAGYDGSYRFALVADVFNQVAEPDHEADNASAPVDALLTAYHADLLPTVVSIPAAATGGTSVPVTWRVTNQGDATTSSNWWIDRVWLSPDGSVGPGSGAIDLGSFGHGGTLAAGASYETTQNVTMPNGVSGSYRLVVQTDFQGVVFESRFKDNNTAVSAGAIALTAAPAVDLRVENVSGPATAQPGQRQSVSWEIANAGSGEARAPWTDHLYLSRDGTMAGAIYLTSLNHDAPLAGGARLQANAQFWMPDVADGEWRVVVVADAYNQVYETGAADAESGNRVAGGVTAVVHPDVRATDIALSAGATAGRSATVSWTARNDGSAVVMPGWVERVFLSSDGTLDGGDLLLGSFAAGAELGAGGTLARSADVMLPATLAAGNWRIIVQSDATNVLREVGGETNNIAVSAAVPVAEAPLPNLAAANVSGPRAMRPGQAVTVNWDELNLLGEPATGTWATQVFLSNDDVLGGDLLVGTVSYSGTVPGNGSVARSAEVTLPTTLQPGNWRFVVKVDSGNALAERNELDNSAIAAADSRVAGALQLRLNAGNVAEAAGSTIATIVRNGDLSQALTIALASSDAGEAAVPSSVTIAAGQASVSFAITLPADGVVDGNQVVRIDASAPGMEGDGKSLTVIDSDTPALALASVLAVREGQGSVRMTVSRNTDASAGDLLVRLTSTNTGALRVPGTVLIPAGAASVSFDAALVDDQEVWGTRDVRVNAVAEGYRGTSANVAVADDELPELTMVFSAAQVAEGAGANAVGVTLRRDRPGAYDLVLNIAADNHDALSVPTRVVIAAGETEVHFNASTVDNGDVNPNRSVTVRATMMAPNGMQIGQNAASSVLTVTDDDGPTLSVTLSAASMSELGAPITGIVRRNTGTVGDLVVTLASSDTSEATVPATVTIRDGQDSATFSVTPVADHIADGLQNATIRASAGGYNPGAAGVSVAEGDLPDLAVTEIGQPAGGVARSRIEISWTVANGGLAGAAGGFRDRVYLSRDGQLSSADRLVAAVIHTDPVAVGGSYTQTASIQLPEETGEYHIIVVTDALGSVAEGSERNNASAGAAAITVRAPLTATVQAAVTQLAVGGEANASVIPLTGSAVDSSTGGPAANQPVKVMVRVGGIERWLDATTDADGNFALDFKPLPGETGRFEIGAGYAGDKQFAVQDSFTLIGMAASVPYIRAMGTNETALEGTFTLKNLSGVDLTGISAALEGLAGNFQFQLTGLGDSLAGDASATVHWSFTGHGVTETLQSSRGTLVLTTAEGATERIVLDLACIPQTPKLVATPGYLAQGMLVGAQTLVSFEVMNQGAADTGPVKVELPDFPWMKLVSPALIDNIAAGAKATVTLALQPGHELDLVRYDGTIALNAKLGSVTVPFQFRAVSEATGEMRVSVEDQLTYYADGAPKLAGATVTLTDPYTFATVATAVTDETGTVLLSGVAEGTYIVTVNADKHNSYRATKKITAGTTTEQTVFLDRQLVSYSWNVVPVDIQDRYKITLESTFETEVPVPVITVDPLKMPVVLPGMTSTTFITLTNHGLIQAENVEIRVPQDDLFEIVALTPMIDVLPAQSSVQVPITIRLKDGVTPEQLNAASMGGNGVNAEGWGSAIVKCLGIDTMYKLRCGADGRWYTESTDIKPVLCAMDLGETGAGQLASYIGDDFNLLDLGCDALDLLLSCFDADDCLSFFINAACGAAVGGLTGGPAGAAAGAAGALDDLLACLCQFLPAPGGTTTPPTGGTADGGPGWPNWGWYTADGVGGGAPWSYEIKYVNCRGEAVSAQEQQLADAGLQEAIASGAVAPDAAEAVAAWNDARADQLAAAVADGNGVLDAEEAGICAQVRIRLEQQAVLTRTAFQGTLEVSNGHPDVPLTGVQLVLDIRDENGNPANDLFASRDPALTGLTGIDGSGVLAGGATGRAQYLFIPTVDAARDAPTRYTIGGTLSYIEGGQKITVPLLPAQITVYPEARLNLHYFQQRDVIGDDPFTKDTVEPSEPFALGLLVYNDGKGDARNLSITSAQPKIIENEKGLLIDFKIAGTEVGDQQVAPTLTANLGNIAAGKTQVAQWLLTSSLQGKFIDYSASFEHLDGMGDTRLSLIESVNIHELIRSVKANPGDAPDFLANDDPDPGHTPDRLYLNDGSQHVVRAIANASAAGSARPGAMAVTITADATSGWGYLQIADPGVGYTLDRIVRSDGKVLTLGREVWRTDRSFPESIPGAVRETLLHFIDEDSTGQYTAYFKSSDAVAPRLMEIVAVAPDPAAGPVDTIDVRFSEALDPASFSVADLRLVREGDASANLLDGASGVTVTDLGGGMYRIGGLAAFTADNGLYRLTVDAAGVADDAGNAGQGVLTETWGIGDIGPYVLSMAAGPGARNTPLDTVDITFNTALDVSSFSADDLRLERDGVLQPLDGATLTLTPLAGNQYRLGGLAPLTAAAGNYTLTLAGAGLLSSGGAAGLSSQAVGWRMDTVAPQVIDVIDLVEQIRNTVVTALDVELSEQVDLASFDYRDITLTRTVGGVTSANLIDARTKVEHVAGNTYRITGFNWVSGLEGNYRLSINGEGIADEAGNSGAGSASQAWTMDTHQPLAASGLAVSPDTGSSDSDGLLNTLRFTLGGSVGEAGVSVRVSDRTSGNEIGYATVDGTSFSIPVALDAAGRHELRVRTVDAAGNLADSTIVVFVDQVRPTLATPELARDADGNVDHVTFNFSEALDPASVSLAAFGLARDGAALVLDGATLTQASPNQWVLGGLAALTAPAGGYRLSVDMGRLRDPAGNAGSAAAPLDFAGALASTGSVSGVVFDDIDGNGTREADELEQGGWTVFDDADADGQLDAGEASAVTDTLGRYALQGLALGGHRITVLTPDGWTITPAPALQVTLDAQAPDATRNLGAFALASLSGTVFDDANANGVRDAGEAALAGRQVLFDLNGNGEADAGEQAATTDAAGRYQMGGLKPGAGRVVLFAGDGWLALQPAGAYSPKSGEAATRELAAVRPATINGMKYEDANGNGQFDAGEQGISGWRIFLDDNGNDALDTGERFTYTDADGRYSFTQLAPGSYRVVEEVRAGWIQTAPGNVEAGGGTQSLDVQLSLPGMTADVEEDKMAEYLASTGANNDCGCGSFVLEKYTSGQAAGHFTKLDTLTDSMLASLTGRGVRVAVIDTGINTSSSFFGPDANGDGVADRIAFQYDFGDGDGDASDIIGHGTNVAGVIAGSDALYDGVATEADLVVLKVFDSQRQGYMSTLRSALEWLDANAEKYGIGVVNMSLGDGGNWGDAISRYGMGDLFQRLAAKGLIMVAASGNNYYQGGGALGVAYPGADPAVLSVGALWAGNFGGPWRFSTGATDYTTAYGRIASFSQRDTDQTDVMAPGARFTSAGLNGGLSTMQGTSQAAAFMSGAAALVQQAAKNLMGRYLTTGEFTALLDANSYRAVDGDDESDNVSNSGAAYNKLDIPKLLNGLKAYAAAGGTGSGGGGGDTGAGDSPLTAYAARTVAATPGATLDNVDFGNFKLGQVAGQVFDDANRDGVQQEGEGGQAGVTVFIDANDNGLLDDGEQRATTDAQGRFAFGALGPGALSIRALAPDGQQATGAPVQRVEVTSGLDQSTLRFGFAATAPLAAADDSAALDEDGSVTIDVIANDDLGGMAGVTLALEGDGPAHGSVALVDGQFVYTPDADFFGSDSFDYTVTAPDGRRSTATVSIAVRPVNDAPQLAPVADQVVAEGDTLVLQLAAGDADGDALTFSLEQAPEGATIDAATGEVRWTAAALTGPQLFRVRVGDGAASAEQSFSVEVRLGKLVVTSFAAQAWGVAIRFNDVIDQSQFNLWGANPDLELRGARVGVVAGSVVFDADGMGLRFVRTGGTLDADSYTLRIKSGAAALTNGRRGDLDGDADGSTGGDFVSSFSAAAVPPVRLRLPDFARAAGQAVRVPNTGAGLPVTLVTDGSTRDLSFRLMVDPALIAVTQVNGGSGLPAGATVQVVAIEGGFQVSIHSATPIAAGTRQVLNLVGGMNSQAAAGSAGVLRIEDLLVNGVAAPGAVDAGVVFVGGTGDMDGNGIYDGNDVTALQRLVVKLDTMLPWANDIDAVVVGDVDADGVLTSKDVAYVQQRAKATSTAMIPAMPAPQPLMASSTLSTSQPATSSGTLAAPSGPGMAAAGAAALKLDGSFGNFSVKPAPARPAGLVAAAGVSLPVTLQIVPKAVAQASSEGVAV